MPAVSRLVEYEGKALTCASEFWLAAPPGGVLVADVVDLGLHGDLDFGASNETRTAHEFILDRDRHRVYI